MSYLEKYNNLTREEIIKELDIIDTNQHSERKVSDEIIEKEIIIKRYLVRILNNSKIFLKNKNYYSVLTNNF